MKIIKVHPIPGDIFEKLGFYWYKSPDKENYVADELVVIDRGKIVAKGSPQSLKDMAKTKSLEDAFIALTGHAIRDEEASAKDRMRLNRKMWRGR